MLMTRPNVESDMQLRPELEQCVPLDRPQYQVDGTLVGFKTRSV